MCIINVEQLLKGRQRGIKNNNADKKDSLKYNTTSTRNKSRQVKGLWS